MIQQTIQFELAGSLPGSCMKTYIIEDSPEFVINKRPVVIVCPGGGYAYLSDREGEVLAMQYVAMGYHAVVLHYSIAPAVFPAAFLEMAACVLLLREKAEEWHIDPDKIIVEGSSAGGHVAAGYGMFWKQDFIAEGIGLESADREILRPNGMILNYPVITSGEFAHRDSFVNLLGDRYEELVEQMSLEKQVSADTPPAFIWHTFTDGCVPVENSLLLVGAMRRAGISVEFHMYPSGGHGLGLANKLTESPFGYEIEPCCQSWIGLVHTWLQHLGKKEFDEKEKQI